MNTIAMNKTAAHKIVASSSARSKAEEALDSFTSGEHFHPLEMIHFFRQWPRSIVRNLIYTLILNALFALAFTLLAFIFDSPEKLWPKLGEIIQQNLLISNVIGFAFWGIFEAIGPLTRIINRQSFMIIALFYTVVGMGVVTASMFLVSFFPGNADIRQWLGTRSQLTTSFVLSFTISMVLTIVWRRRAEELTTQISLAEERERTEAAVRATSEASLRALQAQIEPHFLFNTLANVTGLIHSQPDQAKQMLEQFIAYLRATLAATREKETTLSADVEMMKTFLSILQIRMGERLKVHIDLPDDLRDVSIPPMLLQPLVENAIKHGLEPKMEGGEVSITAKRVGEQIAITVADTGLGFKDSGSNGIGLKNVRERVKQLYGDAGSVSIEENKPCGTRITISFDAK